MIPWWWLVVIGSGGLIVGGSCGILIISLCIAASKRGSERLDEKSGIPEYVDLERMRYALWIENLEINQGLMFCRGCGATRPKHGFYPMSFGGGRYDEDDVFIGSISHYVCNCCHATAESPCPYCEEEKRTGRPINVSEEEQ